MYDHPKFQENMLGKSSKSLKKETYFEMAHIHILDSDYQMEHAVLGNVIQFPVQEQMCTEIRTHFIFALGHMRDILIDKYLLTWSLSWVGVQRIHKSCTVPFILNYPDRKVHGANMGPIWVLLAPDGPHVGTMNLTIRVRMPQCISLKQIREKSMVCCTSISPWGFMNSYPSWIIEL